MVLELSSEQQARYAQVRTIHHGAGSKGLDDACVMQAVDWVYRDKDHFTDAPDCTPPSLRAFAIRLNDARWPTDKDRTDALRPLIPLLVGADPSFEAERKRAYLFTDFAVSEAAPYWFDTAYEITKKDLYRKHAAKMRAVAVMDQATAERARAASAYTYAAASAAASADAYTYASAAASADAYTYAAAYTAAYTYAAASAAASADAYTYAAAAAAAAAYTYAAADTAAYTYASASADAAVADVLVKYRLPILRRAAEVLGEACRVTA